MNKYIFFIYLFFPVFSFSQNLHVIPKPIKTEVIPGSLLLTPQSLLFIEKEKLEKSAHFFNLYLKKYYGFKLPVVIQTPITVFPKNETYLILKTNDHDLIPKNGYELNVSGTFVEIQGANEEGVFNGIQTLIQLLPTKPSKYLSLHQLKILDAPRFSYRGLHFDVSRHFYGINDIKKILDFMALHKLNVFHWHLTDDQGWRVEIKKYPKLALIGGCRKGTQAGRDPKGDEDHIPVCGFYTQEQIKEVVKYARERFITIVPEIEMPGHASAALAAYPELGCASHPYEVQTNFGTFESVFCVGNEKVFSFLEDVLDEVIALFPSRMIHIGGDEVLFAEWENCESCKQRMQSEGLKDYRELEGYFIGRIEKYLNSKGRKVIGWDEVFDTDQVPHATIMSWRGLEAGIKAAKKGRNVIMTPLEFSYFDHCQSKHETEIMIGGYLPVENVYRYDPVSPLLSAQESKKILGGQANVWTEYMATFDKVEYMIFPRLSALSEALWTQKENKNWDHFLIRLKTQFERYDLWKVKYNTKGIRSGEE